MALVRKVVFILFIALPGFAVAQRLPQGVVPEHYDLTFTPDLAKATFAGEEIVRVRVLKPTTSITLNAIELEFSEASVTQGEKTQVAQPAFHPEKEQVTLAVAEQLEPGLAEIRIKFTGILNDKLRGFYLAKTRLRNYAVTQFEATDARRAFPSFDEPALKAKFDLTLIVDQGDTAISNGHLMADVSGPGAGKHTLKFSTTPAMSTYLVAMAVGDFQCSEGSADNIPIRVCGTPDKKSLQAAALRYAGEILKYYNQYYGTPYPFGKLDIVGAPDFEAGAMENTAAIFYRESLLFIDDKNASVKAHQDVFEVLAHEMAHQWFGDLVTMKWWDNLWLNEGFATWMALKPSQALHPEWNAVLDAVRETDDAQDVDTLTNTHPIRAKAETPEEINEMFDAISYKKGASVLRMVESYVSPEVFRRGVNNYLKKFAYSNATAEDFWGAVALASGRPVDKIMPTFVEQAGAPLVTVKVACVTPPAQPAPRKTKGKRYRKPVQPHPKTEITVSQERFSADGSADPGKQTWLIPVCIKSDSNKPFCQLSGERQQVVPAVGCSSWVFTNANAVGYYRTQYDPELFKQLSASAMSGLTTAERMSLILDEAALVQSGREKVGSLLDLVTALSSDQERAVVESYSSSLESINDYLVTPADREAYHSWIRSTFRPMMARVKWTPVAGESDDTRGLRAELVNILGTLGEDPDTIRESTRLARQYLQDPNSLDATLAARVLRVAARYGGTALLDEYLAGMARMRSPEQYYALGRALAEFRGQESVERVLQLAISPEIRNQDAAHSIARVLENADNQSIAWQWIKAHWPDVEKKTTMSSGADIVNSAEFCDSGSRDDVEKFFAEHKVPSAERALRQATERMNRCISYRERQQGNLSVWLAQHAAAGNAGIR